MKVRACILCTAFFTISLSFATRIFAQNKSGKKMDEALTQRFEADKRYAESQRWIFNQEKWKNSWIGVKYSDLVKSWGAPTKAFPNGEGGQVVVYEKVSNYSGGSFTPGYIETATNGFGQTVITDQKNAVDARWQSQYIETTTVYVGKNNLIEKVENTINSNHSGKSF